MNCPNDDECGLCGLCGGRGEVDVQRADTQEADMVPCPECIEREGDDIANAAAEQASRMLRAKIDVLISDIKQQIVDTPGVKCGIDPLTEQEALGLLRRTALGNKRDGLIEAWNTIRNLTTAELRGAAG